VLPIASSLRLGPKIGLSIMLFLLPVALILVLLASAQNKDIGFAEKEVAGTRALTILGGIQAAADRALVSRAAFVRDSSLVQSAPAFGTLALEQEAAALAGILHDADDASRLATARVALRALQSKVGDRSNLILDDVLDTYYTNPLKH
jgi:methyl-accepting chemotaxis protein